MLQSQITWRYLAFRSECLFYWYAPHNARLLEVLCLVLNCFKEMKNGGEDPEGLGFEASLIFPHISSFLRLWRSKYFTFHRFVFRCTPSVPPLAIISTTTEGGNEIVFVLAYKPTLCTRISRLWKYVLPLGIPKPTAGPLYVGKFAEWVNIELSSCTRVLCITQRLRQPDVSEVTRCRIQTQIEGAWEHDAEVAVYNSETDWRCLKTGCWRGYLDPRKCSLIMEVLLPSNRSIILWRSQ